MPTGVYLRTKKHIRNMNESRKGKHFSKEHKKKQSDSHKGKKYPKEEYPNHGMRNKEHSEETKNKMRKPKSEKAKKRMKGHSGVYERTEVHRGKMKGHCGVYLRTEEHRENISKGTTRRYQDPKEREKTGEASKKFAKKLWKNPDYQKAIRIGLALKPNKLEQFFDERTPECVKYVGDFKLPIITKKGTRFPDFVIEAQNKVIALFGGYWHKGENSNDKIKEYVNAGWDCIIFWEYEVHNETEKVLKETLEFIEEKEICKIV